VISICTDPVTGLVTAPLFSAAVKDMFGKGCAENVEDVLLKLGQRIENLEQTLQKSVLLRLETTEGMDLQYQVCFEALSAFSDERRERIALIALKGFVEDDKKLVEAKHFLKLLKQFDDEDIAILVRQYRHEINRQEGSVQVSEGLEISRRNLLITFGLLQDHGGFANPEYGRLSPLGSSFVDFICERTEE